MLPTSLKSIALSAISTAALATPLSAASAQAAMAPPSDAQIAAIVVAANQVDIDAGKLAESKAKADNVKGFAKQMVTDHTSVNNAAVALVTKLNVKPEDNETSASLKKGGADNIANLKKLQGVDFDRAYVQHEVTYHQTVLDTLDKTLIPSAKNGELRALLEKTQPAFVAHLEHAKSIQASLTK